MSPALASAAAASASLTGDNPDGPRRQFGPRLAENTSGRPDAFDRFTEEKEEYSDREPVHPGALYEVSFEWERGGDEGLQPESLDWVAARLNELRWHCEV